jgi:hypothetical protein
MTSESTWDDGPLDDGNDITFGRPLFGEPGCIVVPRAGLEQKVMSEHGVAPGSGMTAFMGDDGRAVVYFEGNLYGASNIKTIEDKAIQAYGRMAARYPTRAMTSMPASMLEVVGYTDGRTVQVFGSQGRQGLDRWSECGEALHEPTVKRTAAPR